MAWVSALNHAANFLAPALWLAIMLPLLAKLFIRNKPLALTFKALIALNFIVGSMLLLAGLMVFGRDGKMLTYLALVLGVASHQWFWLRR